MKKMMLFMFLLLTGLVQASDKAGLKDIDELTFFGVDYSMVKVYGADESAEQFKTAFTGINNLFLSEPKKYDTAKAFKTKVITNITTSVELIRKIESSSLFAESDNYSLSEDAIAGHIKWFDTGDAKGYGALLIAEFLNKGKHEGTYQVVIFDIETKKILESKQFTGDAKGFGLRNYWAGSVYKVLGQIKKNM